MGHLFRGAVAALLLVLASGCATNGGNPQDPWEPFNRSIFSFNDAVDNAVLKPVAEGYRAALPDPVRTGVSNFFSNLEDVWIGVNNVLQGKVADGVQDFARFVFNSTFGLLGLIDVSTSFNLPKHDEDFGQTLGRWGVGSGNYLVLPIFGPSSIRDGVGFAVDFHADIVRNLSHVPTRNTLFVARAINTRANLLDIGRVAEEAALDKYRFIREAYLQRRRSLVYDGDPPRERDSSSMAPLQHPSVAAESIPAAETAGGENASLDARVDIGAGGEPVAVASAAVTELLKRGAAETTDQ